MPHDHVVDTNVLILGSASETGNEGGEVSPVPWVGKLAVFDWLVEFQADPTRILVLDVTSRQHDSLILTSLTHPPWGLGEYWF